jgi:hypothetical protein
VAPGIEEESIMRPRPWFLLLASLAALAALIPADAARAGAIITAYSQDVITGIGLKPGLANNFNVTSTDSSSTDLAELNSAGKVTNTDKLDPKFAAVGPNAGAAQENTFVIIGPHVAKSDAAIQNTLTAASNDALVNLEKFDTGTAFATNDLQAYFTLTNADKLTLSFSSAVLLQVFLDKTVQNGSAEASLTVNIDITEWFGNFNQVFQWRPDGVVNNNITGGTENADPFDLNKTLSLSCRATPRTSRTTGTPRSSRPPQTSSPRATTRSTSSCPRTPSARRSRNRRPW